MRHRLTMQLFWLFIITLAAYTQSLGQGTAPPAGMGNACKFTSGPRAGQTQDYSQLPPLPLGSSCQDGQSPVSTGTVVALGGSAAPSGGGPPAGMGNACKFTSGPRAGQTQDYSQLPPLPLGSPCQDGQSPVSTGTVVTLGGSAAPSGGGPPAGMGNACKFTSGPRAGQTQDYSQLPPLPLGSPCQDGQSPVSTGTVVALGNSTQSPAGGSPRP
jgi:hypothetical protein